MPKNYRCRSFTDINENKWNQNLSDRPTCSPQYLKGKFQKNSGFSNRGYNNEEFVGIGSEQNQNANCESDFNRPVLLSTSFENEFW